MVKELLGLAGVKKGKLKLMFVLMGVRGILVVIPMLVLYAAVNALAISPADMARIAQMTLVLFLAYVLLNVIDHYLWVACMRVGYAIGLDVRMKLGDKILRLPLGYFTGRSTGQVGTAMGAYASMPESTVYLSAIILSYQFSALAVLILYLLMDWRLAFASLLIFPIAYVAYRRIHAITARISKSKEEALRSLNSALIEFVQGIPVIRVFNLGNTRLQWFKEAVEKFRDCNVRLVTDNTGPSIAFILILSLDIVIILSIGIYLYTMRYVRLDVLLFFVITTPLFTDSLFGWLHSTVEHKFHIAEAAEKIREIMEETQIAESFPGMKPETFEIQFEDVKFSYGDSETLRGVSFSVPEGSVAALVGPSGAGKTTIMNLLARFWDVDSGAIRIGGIDIREMAMKDLMASIAIVFQEVILINDTVMENIRIGRSGASDEEVMAAAGAAGCEGFIESMPAGYATILGDSGSGLSEGQKQRIAIARALLKNAPILILDEATAYIDPDNERIVQQAINTLTVDRTVLVIAHRLSTVANADQILVIDEGKLVESGNHDDLLKAEGLYRRFWKAQSAAKEWRI